MEKEAFFYGGKPSAAAYMRGAAIVDRQVFEARHEMYVINEGPVKPIKPTGSITFNQPAIKQ